MPYRNEKRYALPPKAVGVAIPAIYFPLRVVCILVGRFCFTGRSCPWNKKKKTPCKYKRFSMELRGIEPLSENQFPVLLLS